MKKLYLTILYMVLTISVFAFPASAALADPDDTVTIYGRDYSSALDKCSSLSSVGGNVPDGYSLIGVAVYPDFYSVGHNTRVDYFYAFNYDSWTAYTSSNGYLYTSKQPNSASMYRITNRFTDDSQVYVDAGNTSGTNISTANFRFISYIPVYDDNGNISRPFVPLVDMSVCGISQGVHCHIQQSTGWIPDLVHWDLYLFPSDIPVSGGTVNRVIQSSKYITELTPSEVTGLTNSGFGSLLDELQENYNNYYSGGSWYNRGLPQIHFFAECQDTSLSYRFDPDFYNLPYAKISSGGANGVALIRREDFYGGSRVYTYDHLALILVARGESKDSIVRYDFTPALLNDGSISPPAQIEDKDTYVSGSVSDFQELADYLKYLISTLDNNNTINDNNFLATLNTIPWSNYISGGVSAGLDDWLPELSDSIDYTFSNLFSDWFIPSAEQMEELEDELEDDREEFEAKFAFIDDVKDEVSFIFETIMRSGDQTRYFEFNLTNYHGVGVVQFNISDKIPANVLTIVKNFITCFLTIAVVMHIFKTLPSTIGKMPSGGD